MLTLPPSGVRFTPRKLSSLVVLFVLAAVLCAGTAAFAFDKDHLMKLEVKKSCPKCDLSGADLINKNMPGINLWGANLSGANLWNAGLRSAKLFSADFTGAYIEGADMTGAKFCRTKMPWGIDNDDCI